VPYIGKQLVRGQNRKLDDISGGFNGSQTTFTLQIASQNVSVGSALQLWISVGGIIQNPLTDFTIAGNQITFTTAPAASLDFFGVIQGDVTDTNTPGDATVTTSKLASGLTVNLADGSAATSSLQLGGTDSGLFSSAADKVNVTTGGVERLEIGSSEVVFNDGSNDVDFRVESNGQTHMLFVDGGNDRIGIGTASPVRDLQLGDNTSASEIISLQTSTSGKGSIYFGDNTATSAEFAGMLRYDHADNSMQFRTSSVEALRIDSSGRMLLGTSSDQSESDANAKVQIFTSSAGKLLLGREDSSVAADDFIGIIDFRSTDGGSQKVARIACQASGAHAANDKPGRLVFSTTAAGASSPTERMRISSDGNITATGTAEFGGVLSVNRTSSGDGCFHAKLNGTTKASIASDGTATFASTIISQGDAGAGANNGSRIDGQSGFSASFDSTGSFIYRGYTTGNSTATFSVSAGGEGLFKQRVKTGHAAVSGTSVDYGITAYSNRTSTGNTSTVFAQNFNAGGRTFCGVNSSGTTTCSILGNGNATFAGSLSKGSGSFKISHPLPAKAETHHLVHSFIEGPQADLIYRGYVDLVDGQATVNIDTAGRMSEGTFEVLCTNVSCFTSNESDWIAVKGSVTGNVLTIAAQDATATSKVSWMVVGERKDQHMIDTDWTDAAGRVITEPEKVVEAVEETEE